MIHSHTVIQLDQQDAHTKVTAAVDADGYLGLYRRQSATERDVAIVVSYHGRPDAVLAELDEMRAVALDAVNAHIAAEYLAAEQMADDLADAEADLAQAGF